MEVATRTQVDPITLEVIHHRLESIVREMGNITLRSARSAVVHHGRDFSCGLFDGKVELLTIGTSIPVHIFPMLAQVRAIVETYADDVHEGDIFIGNDPHDGGTHLNDVMIVLPIFVEGKVIAYACNRAHWYDVGGMVPGSLWGEAREIFQEGLRIPPIRLGSHYSPQREIVDMIARNVRMPEDALGDLWAQLASCRVAKQRIGEVVARYGLDTVLASWDEILELGERQIRARLRSLEDGSVVFDAYLDNDGVDPSHRRIRVRAEVQGERVVVDFSGTAPQSEGCTNVTLASARGFAFQGMKAALDPKGPINSGCFRPIEVVVPPNSMLDARAPAAAGGVSEVGQAAIATMVSLTQKTPATVSAEEGAGANHQALAGVDDRSGRGTRRFIYYDAQSPGGGARAASDGLDYVRSIRSGNYWGMSVEVLETLFPIVFLRRAFRRDSGGAGARRGGTGIDIAYRTEVDTELGVLGDQARIPAAGLYGGYRGAPTKWEVRRGSKTRRLFPRFGSKGRTRLEAGDVVIHGSPGGGGWGDPLERSPEAVQADVLNRKVSASRARDLYGVVLQGSDREINVTSTITQRIALRERRRYLRTAIGPPAVDTSIDPPTGRLNPSDGANGALFDVIALTDPLPVLIRATTDATCPVGTVALDPETAALFGARAGDLVWLREL